MKKLALVVLTLILSLPSMAVTIGMVNMQQVISNIQEGKKINTRLEKEFKEKQSILKKDEGAIKKMQEDYQKQNLVLSDTAKAKKERDIQKEMMKFQQKTMKYQKEIQGLEEKLKKPIIEKLKGVIDQVSKSSKVDITLEISSSPILFAKDTKNLTEDIIKAYDKKYPVK